MKFVATDVRTGTKGAPLELFGILKACQMLNFEKLLGNEEIGTRLGVV